MTKEELACLQAQRRLAGLSIDPETAEIHWAFGEVSDPYGDEDSLPEEAQCIGQIYFARAFDSDEWIVFGDLPEATRKALQKRGDVRVPTVREFWKELQAERPALEVCWSQLEAAYRRACRRAASEYDIRDVLW